MPYDRNAALPKSVPDGLPPGAQTIYRQAFNSAWRHYGEGLETARLRDARGDRAPRRPGGGEDLLPEGGKPVDPKGRSMIWILCANGVRAAIFAASSPIAPLKQVASLDNPEARAKQSELVTDRPGRAFDSKGVGRHAMEPEVEPKEEAQIRFAKAIAGRLEHGRVSRAFERLVLVAGPAFLGLPRKDLGEPLRSLVSLEIDSDYTALKPAELRARLPERL